MKKFLIIIIVSMSITKSYAQYTLVPDPVFEQALIDLSIDSEGTLDGQFLTADTIGVVDLLIDYYAITDMTGIEAFADLERLDARETNFVSLDLSQNPMLNQLTIAHSPLEFIDLSQNPLLFTLILQYCNLSSIDTSNNPNIANYYLTGNNLTEIDLTNNINITGLGLSENYFTEIDLSQNVKLTSIGISEMPTITSLDLSNLPLLRGIQAWENNITAFDFSNNPVLELIYCSNNQLTTLDFSNNPLMKLVDCDHNPLQNVIFSDTSHLEYLSFGDGQLTDLDLSNMPLLEDLIIAENQFTSVDLSNSPKLFRFYGWENNISGHLDVTNNPDLGWLIFSENPITSVDVSQNPELYYFNANNSLLTHLDFSSNPNLETTFIRDMSLLESVDARNGNNDIIEIIAYNSPNLSCIYVDDVSSGDGDFFIDEEVTHLVNNEAECKALGVLDTSLSSLIHVFPNPVKEVLIIKNSISIILKEVEIYDVTGKLLLTYKNHLNRINVSKLSSGILFLKVETDQGVLVKKVVKQ